MTKILPLPAQPPVTPKPAPVSLDSLMRDIADLSDQIESTLEEITPLNQRVAELEQLREEKRQQLMSTVSSLPLPRSAQRGRIRE